MSHRLTWADLPDTVRARIERDLGAPVVAHHTAVGGFSPSTAEIVAGADGRRLFVKAVTAQVNAGSYRLNRAEAAALSAMPVGVPAPALRDAFTDGDWFVLVTDVADGEMPEQPWTPRDLDLVLETLDVLQRVGTPSPLTDLPRVEEMLGEDLRGFVRVTADPPTDLDPWYVPRLPALEAASDRGIAALAGETLGHADLRADNILIARDGTVRFVDWAWTSLGSRFADALQLLSSIDDPHGDLDVSARIDAVMERYGAEPRTATDVLAGILGFFVDAARWDVDPSMPTVRDHRMRRRDALAPLVRARWEREGRC